MKKGIHPKYNKIVVKCATCGAEFETGSTAKELKVDYGNGSTSEIKIVCEGDNAARSDTAQFLHNSEAAFWKDLSGTMASLNQVVSVTNKNSFIIFETTANGYNEYKTLYDKHATGKSSYKALFYPWYGHKKYTAKYDGFELRPHEQKLVDDLHLSYDQIAWYRLQYYVYYIKNTLQLLQKHLLVLVIVYLT